MSDYWIQSLAKLADAKAKKLENATAKLRAAHWRRRVGAVVAQHGATPGPTKCAYHWVRGLAGWQRNPVGQLGENDMVPDEESEEDSYCKAAANIDSLDSCKAIPLSDQAAVERQAADWATLWRVEEQYAAPTFPQELPQLQALFPQALRLAAASFPIGIGLGSDNISPRAILRLSMPSLPLRC